MTLSNAKQRFSNRVADYVRYRPGYPSAIIDLLRTACGLQTYHQVADIGSGTGILSKLFLRNGNFVWGIEPNREMSDAAVEFLGAYPNFISVSGSAEGTTLADNCVDFITVGQAFHWFDPVAARREFRRILRSPGWVVILWYHRALNNSRFTRAYEDLVTRFGIDYEKVKDAYPKSEHIFSFLESENFGTREFTNAQEFELEGLTGLLKSSSYMPDQNHANFAPMMAELQKLWHENEKNGHVQLEYKVQVYCGRLDKDRNNG